MPRPGSPSPRTFRPSCLPFCLPFCRASALLLGATVVFAAGLSSATEAPPLLRNDVVDPFASRPVALAAPEDDDASLVEEPAFDVRANHLLDPFALANAVVDPFDRTPPPAEVPQVEYRCVDRY